MRKRNTEPMKSRLLLLLLFIAYNLSANNDVASENPWLSKDVKSKSYQGPAWGMHLNIAPAVFFLPLNLNTTTDSVPSFSSVHSSGVLGGNAGLESWFYRSPKFGIGGFYNYSYGVKIFGDADGYNKLINYGGRMLLGVYRFRAIGEIAKSIHTISVNQDGADAIDSEGYSVITVHGRSSGLSEYQLTRLSYGLSYDWSDDDDEHSFTVTLNQDNISALINPSSTLIKKSFWRFHIRAVVDLTVDYGKHYYAGGTQQYASSNNKEKNMVNIMFGKTLKLFGGKY